MPPLPLDLILRIFQLATIDEDLQCEEPTSSAYWSWPLPTQVACWNQRLLDERRAWNMSVRLRLVCREFNDLMTIRLKQSAVLMARSSTLSLSPTTIDGSSLTRLKIFTREGCHLMVIWRLLHENSQTIESFFAEMGAAPSEIESRHPMPPLDLQFLTFPRLTTFTFRTNAAREWLKFRDLVLLLQNSPQLKDLTIFQLAGPPTNHEARQFLQAQGEPECQLRSLHIRRVRWIDYAHLKYIVAKSHLTLKKLTWVFESPASGKISSPTYDRGVYEDNTVHQAFLPCTEIETLRVADMVCDPPETPHHAPRSTVQRGSPLYSTLDAMIAGMRKLTCLEISGAIETCELYNILRHDVLPLKSIRITRHPHFRLYLLMSQLKRGVGPLSQLKYLAFDRGVPEDVPPDDWRTLRQICFDKGVQLRMHDGPFATFPRDDDVPTLLERLPL